MLAFLVWVMLSVVPLLLPPKHVRTTDAAGLPPQQVNPRPTIGATPPTPPLTAAQASELLRKHGYFDVASLTQQPGGDWTATASRSANGARLRLRIGRDGRIATE